MFVVLGVDVDAITIADFTTYNTTWGSILQDCHFHPNFPDRDEIPDGLDWFEEVDPM